MLALETRVNGMLIGYAKVLNVDVIDAKNETCIYNVEYYRISKKPAVIDFNIVHKKSEGAEKLALLVYQELDRYLKDNSP